MLVQLVLLSSLLSLIWFCEAHAPLHRVYYGPHQHVHRLNPSMLSSSSVSPSSNVDLSSFGNRFRDTQSSSPLEGDQHHNQLYSKVNYIPPCNQLKFLWKEANRLTVNLYGPDLAFTHPKLHANPFYLTNILLRKHNHLYPQIGGVGGGRVGLEEEEVEEEEEEGGRKVGGGKGFIGKGISLEPGVVIGQQLNPVNPNFDLDYSSNNNKINVNSNSDNNIYPDFGKFGEIQDRFESTNSLGSNGFSYKPQLSKVPGQFSDYSVPKSNLGTIYGTILMSPDQPNNQPSNPSSSSSSPSSSSSSFPSSSSVSTQSTSGPSNLPSSSSSLSSTTPRKDANHSGPKFGFGAILSNSKETFEDPGGPVDEISHSRASESSKKVDNFFSSGIWHDHPIDLSYN